MRQIDSSLLDEWEALTDPAPSARAAAAHITAEPPPPPRPITANEQAFRVMLRNAMFQKVQLAARGRFTELGELQAAAALSEPPSQVTMAAVAWERRLGAPTGTSTRPWARGPPRGRRSC